jgi:hypothetical protein
MYNFARTKNNLYKGYLAEQLRICRIEFYHSVWSLNVTRL